jgi:hypothetical protein
MRLPRWTCYVGILTGVFLVLGCGDSKSGGMRNMEPGTGPAVQLDIKTKHGKKPLPAEPPPPKAPP